MLDATLTVLPSLGHRVSRRGAHQAHIGTGEHAVRLRVLGPESLAPGETGRVRLHLPTPLPLVRGDRYVLREAGRSETVGGGVVLDVAPVLPATRAAPDDSVDRVVAERGWVDVALLERLTGERREPTLETWVIDPDVLAAAGAALRERVAGAGDLGLDVATLDPRDRAVLATIAEITVDGGRARLTGADDPLADHPFLALLAGSPFAPPAPEGVDPSELTVLAQRGRIVSQDGIWFAATALDQASGIVAGLLRDHPDGITMSQLREALGTSRKYAVPLATLLDARGVTRRRDDLRIPGPRLPEE